MVATWKGDGNWWGKTSSSFTGRRNIGSERAWPQGEFAMLTAYSLHTYFSRTGAIKLTRKMHRKPQATTLEMDEKRPFSSRFSQNLAESRRNAHTIKPNVHTLHRVLLERVRELVHGAYVDFIASSKDVQRGRQWRHQLLRGHLMLKQPLGVQNDHAHAAKQTAGTSPR